MTEPARSPEPATGSTGGGEKVGTPQERAEALARLRALPGWPTEASHPDAFAWANRVLGVDSTAS